MKKSVAFFFLLLIAATVQVHARKITGVVTGEGRPLAGVIVSDGYGFTLTDVKGKFKMDTAPDARTVFAVAPAGYAGDWSGGTPRFFAPLDGGSKFKIDLKAYGKGNDYTILAISDTQTKDKSQLSQFAAEPLADLCKVSAEKAAENTTVAMTLGDIAWNKLDIYPAYLKEISKVSVPVYPVIGNHDYIQNLGGIAAAKTYEETFGPYNYAFFLGKDLVLSINNIVFYGTDALKAKTAKKRYVEGYSHETLEFVRGLLKYVGKDTHIYIAQHSPLVIGGRRRILHLDAMLSILAGYKVDFFTGHTHYMRIHDVTPSVRDNNVAAIGGAWWDTMWCRDGTPRGYGIFTCKNGSLSRRWHNIDYPDDFQVEFLYDTRWNPGAIVANVWDYDNSWTVEWYQDGQYVCRLTRRRDCSPTYVRQITEVFEKRGKKIPAFKTPARLDHYFAAVPSDNAAKAEIVVKAPDGRQWRHEFDLVALRSAAPSK